MTIQICGTAILITAIICTTWYVTMLRRDRERKADEIRNIRFARNERIYNNGTMGLYEDEVQRRIAAETKVGIKETIIDRQAKEIERLKGLISVKESKNV